MSMHKMKMVFAGFFMFFGAHCFAQDLECRSQRFAKYGDRQLFADAFYPKGSDDDRRFTPELNSYRVVPQSGRPASAWDRANDVRYVNKSFKKKFGSCQFRVDSTCWIEKMKTKCTAHYRVTALEGEVTLYEIKIENQFRKDKKFDAYMKEAAGSLRSAFTNCDCD